jgi:hypothetical protein
MAKHGTDPVLGRLVRAINESAKAQVPVTVSAHGTTVTGVLIAEDTYFTELAEGSPLLSALRPASGLLDKEYTKDGDLIIAGRAKPSQITSHELPLAEAPGAHDQFDKRVNGYTKVLLHPAAA